MGLSENRVPKLMILMVDSQFPRVSQKKPWPSDPSDWDTVDTIYGLFSDKPTEQQANSGPPHRPTKQSV